MAKGLDLQPMEAKAFTASSGGDAAGCRHRLLPVNPIKALFWSRSQRRRRRADHGRDDAHGGRPDIMGNFVITRRLKRLGWLATAPMGIAVVAMLAAFFV